MAPFRALQNGTYYGAWLYGEYFPRLNYDRGSVFNARGRAVDANTPVRVRARTVSVAMEVNPAC